jgi:hypothetical protein
MRLIRWCIAGAGSLAVLFGGWYILQHLLNVDGAASWAAAGLAAGVAIAVLGWWAGLDGNRPTTASMVANTKIRIKRVRNSPIRIDVSPYRQEPRPRVPAPPVTGPVVVGDVPRQPPAFQTRDALLILPDDQMPRRQGHSLTYAITGMRGVGKTQLAAAQARRCIEGKWRLVAWINADTTATILNGLAEAAAVMGVQPGADEEASAKELRHLLETGGQRCLLVFDNAPDAAAVRPYLPAVGDACVLITSTSQSISSLGTSVAVGVFTEPEALSYLGERTTIDDDGQAAELAAEVGHLPLALAQAAAVIRAQHISYSTYLDRLRTFTAEEYLAPAGEDAYPLGAAAAIILALRAVQAADTSGLTVDLMRLLAVLSPAGVPRTILSAAGGRVMQRRWFLSVRRARPGAMAPAVDAALGDLAGASLLTFSLDGALVTAHRLTMRVIRERCLHEGDLEKVGAAAIDLLATAINAAEPTWQHIEAAKGLTEQIEALAVNLRPVLANSTGKLALELLELRGWALRCLTRLRDNPAQAISVGKALTVDLESALGADDMQTLTAINNLAGAYRSAGLVREGIPLFERAVDGLQRACGPDHPETLAALSNLGAAYRETEQLDKAIGVPVRPASDRRATWLG